MIKISDLRLGDYVIASFENKDWTAKVIELNHEKRSIKVKTSVQDFWFDEADLTPILLDDTQLLALGFEKKLLETGETKYLKGPFRVLVPRKGDFSEITIWYREDRRSIRHHLYVHQFQNHYLDMTKVELLAN